MSRNTIREKGRSIIDFPNDFVVLDLETTGLDPTWDEIIEIGAIKYRNCELIDTFSTLIRPKNYSILDVDDDEDAEDYSFIDGQKVRYVSRFITGLTGITNKMLEDKPVIDKPLKELIEFIGEDYVVGYNVSFDVNFIYDNYFNSCGGLFQNHFIDVMRIAKKQHKELNHHRLKDMCALYGLDYQRAHRALEDCVLTFNVFQHLKEDIQDSGLSLDEFAALFTKSSSRKNISMESLDVNENIRDETNSLYGKEVVITGTLKMMSKKEAYTIIKSIGGVPRDNGITKNTNFLVIADKEYNQLTRKKKKAQEYISKGQDLEIISESSFYDLIGFSD